MGHLRLVPTLPSAADSGASASNLMPELLDTARLVPRQSDIVRARAITRARAALATAAAFEPPPPSRGRARRLGVAATVCLAFAVGAAGATAALHDRGWRSRPVDALPAAAMAPPATKTPESDHAPADPLVSAGPVSVIRPQRAPRAQVRAPQSYAAEVECLARAQVAFAGGDFRGALAASLEHARRFPNGWLAEQREALRVRSLAGVGLTDEARRAAAAFGERFPRSVFLSRLQD
jgi:hypothetical protein